MAEVEEEIKNLVELANKVRSSQVLHPERLGVSLFDAPSSGCVAYGQQKNSTLFMLSTQYYDIWIISIAQWLEWLFGIRRVAGSILSSLVIVSKSP